jgi:membrane-associated protein
VTSLQRLTAALADVVSRTGGYAPAILVLATFVEYVFPPFPGDLVVVLGAWYAVQGQLSWPATFASVMVGALLGAWVDYRVGAWLGRRLEVRLTRRGPLSAENLAAFEAAYRRWGGLLIVANRFFPGIRAFIFVAAGASGIPLARVLVLGMISAALWNAVLLGAGAVVARNVDDLVAIFDRYTQVAWGVVAAGGLVALAAWLRRTRRAAGGPP